MPFWQDGLHTHILHLSKQPSLEWPLWLDLQKLSDVPTVVALCSSKFARAMSRLPQRRANRSCRRRSCADARAVSVPEPVAGCSVGLAKRSVLSSGAYSSVPLGATLGGFDRVADPVGGRLLFAGEGTSRARPGYADGAISTGIREAKRLLQTPSVELSAG